MKKRLSAFLRLILLPCLLTGCTAAKIAREEAETLKRRNMTLQTEIGNLQEQLARQNTLNAHLQLALLQKNAELSRSGDVQKKPSGDARNTIRTPTTDTKVETVAYLAEVTTELESARKESRPHHAKLFAKAENLLAKSNLELAKDRYARATLLASQALDLVAQSRSDADRKQHGETGTYHELPQPLPLAVTQKSNVRKAPHIHGRLLTTLDATTNVTAYGYQGRWVNIMLQDGRKGWIHYSLVALPDKKKTRH